MSDPCEAGNSTPPPSTSGDKCHYHILLLQRGKAFAEFDRDLVRLIQGLVEETVTTPPDKTKFTIWLDTPGGDAHATYKLFLELRGRCDALEAIVPDYAKSAGTLLLLGVDKIYMSLAAELGPLDAQIGHPDREELIVSALDVAGSLEHLARTALGFTITGGAQALQFVGLPRAELFKSMLTFTSEFLKPAVSKVDPHLVHRATEQLNVAKRYAKSMLARRKGMSRPLVDADAEQLLRRLVEQYPEHGYIISRDEAKRLGLPIHNAEDHPRWTHVKDALQMARVTETSDVRIILDRDLEDVAGNEEGETDEKAKPGANGISASLA